MIHAIGYLGPYDPNIGRLGLSSTQYVRYDGTMGNIDEPPDNLDGVFFGYLEKSGREFYAVRARYLDVLVNLEKPVLLEPTRHTDGKGFGPKPSQFEDTSAANLLRDMIADNPAQATALSQIGTKSGLLT
jgi:hypothetical protein